MMVVVVRERERTVRRSGGQRVVVERDGVHVRMCKCQYACALLVVHLVSGGAAQYVARQTLRRESRAFLPVWSAQ